MTLKVCFAKSSDFIQLRLLLLLLRFPDHQACHLLRIPLPHNLLVYINIINLRLDITHLYYPAKNSFQKSRLKRREIFTELLLYTLTTKKCP